MSIHKHVPLTPRGRARLVLRMVDQERRVAEAAQATGLSVRTAYKWLARYRSEGPAGVTNRSLRPGRRPHVTPAAVAGRIIEQRRQRHTYPQIAPTTALGRAPVG